MNVKLVLHIYILNHVTPVLVPVRVPAPLPPGGHAGKGGGGRAHLPEPDLRQRNSTQTDAQKFRSLKRSPNNSVNPIHFLISNFSYPLHVILIVYNSVVLCSDTPMFHVFQ